MEKYRFITKKAFKDLVTGLVGSTNVYGPVKKDGFPSFEKLGSFNELDLSLTPTHLSAKKYLFPPRETLLKFDIEKKTFTPVVEACDQVIIGLHSCDIHGLGLMDRVFEYGTRDANYLARRARTVIIGTDCLPDEHCFCKSLGTDRADTGFDLYLHTVKKGFAVRIGTEKGAGILSKYAPGKAASKKELKEMEGFLSRRDASFVARIDAPAAELPQIYSKSDDSPVWDKIGSICYGCGSCNNVCPTCYCFDVRDEVSADLKQGERVRVWDGCTLEDFAKVAGGHSFRKTRAQRLRHRFNRKFNYLTDKFGALFCVGCGRCSRTCLVNINISKVTNELIKEYRERGGKDR